MKTKLLKKLHKRYDWYFNNDGYPVLIDHYQQTVILFDLEYCMAYAKYTLEDVEKKVKVSKTEWAIRFFKDHILRKWGWEISRVRYKVAIRRLKTKRNG